MKGLRGVGLGLKGIFHRGKMGKKTPLEGPFFAHFLQGNFWQSERNRAFSPFFASFAF